MAVLFPRQRKGMWLVVVALMGLVGYLLTPHLTTIDPAETAPVIADIDIDGNGADEQTSSLVNSSDSKALPQSTVLAIDPSNSAGDAKDACISQEQWENSSQLQETKRWLDSLGSGLIFDIAFGSRDSHLAAYLDYPPEKLAALITQGDPKAKLVKAELNYAEVRKIDTDPSRMEHAINLMRESRELWWDAVIEGGYTTALTSIGQSYFIEKEILRKQNKLSYARQVELEKLSYRYGEASEALIEGLGDNFYNFGPMMAPSDDLKAALEETVAMVEVERKRRNLPSLRIHVPPEREWVMAQEICDE